MIFTLILFLGCSEPSQLPVTEKKIKEPDVSGNIQNSNIPTEKPFVDEEEPKEEHDQPKAEFAEITESTENGRPVIVHRYSTIILCNGLPAISNYAENVISVTDPEDGELSYNNIGGIGAVTSEEDLNKTIYPEDNPEAVAAVGFPFYFSIGTNLLQGSPGTVPVMTVAYDSQGQVSYKEYEIIYIAAEPNEAIDEITVLVDGLRVRNTPSISGDAIGNVWKSARYYIYEKVEESGYTWYRIGNDMWIADNGEWLEF